MYNIFVYIYSCHSCHSTIYVYIYTYAHVFMALFHCLYIYICVCVSKNHGTPKWMVYNKPRLKFMIWGYQYFWKHPYIHILILFCVKKNRPVLLFPGASKGALTIAARDRHGSGWCFHMAVPPVCWTRKNLRNTVVFVGKGGAKIEE